MVLANTVTELIRDEAESQLDDAGHSVDAVETLPGGTVPWDRRCDRMWVRTSALVPSFTNGCYLTMIRHDVRLGILRCIPDMDNQGNPPSTSDNTETAEKLMEDAVILLRALQCVALPVGKNVVIGEWHPQGPQITMAGGYWDASITYTGQEFHNG